MLLTSHTPQKEHAADLIALVRKHVTNGRSFAETGELLGLTKNQVAGICFRQGIKAWLPRKPQMPAGGFL